MAATLRAATGGSGTASTSVATSLPAGATSGDLVLIQVIQGADAISTFSATAGWTVQDDTAGTISRTALVWRLLDGTGADAAPTITWGTSGRFAWVAAAVQPGAGETLAIDVAGNVKVDAAATSHTANAATPAAGNAAPLSLIFTGARAGANGATAITTTAPTNWVEPANGDFSTSTGATSRQVSASVSTRALASNATVTPGALTLSVSATANLHHVLIEATAGAVAAVAPPYRRPERRQPYHLLRR